MNNNQKLGLIILLYMWVIAVTYLYTAIVIAFVVGVLCGFYLPTLFSKTKESLGRK